MATVDEATANHVIQTINGYLHLPIHNMGLITRFNGMDIDQTSHCHKYITKMASLHEWMYNF